MSHATTEQLTPKGFFELGDTDPAGKAYKQCLDSIDKRTAKRLKKKVEV